MELNHSFTVPATLAETWKAFEDIESVAGCFPGATVTEVDGDDFKGTCKVKLGPIALVYSGQGTFVEKDESARRFVIDAKGKDKRGNGTAGAKVTATFAEEGEGSTTVQVSTDLSITGKPAQFGRGVIEDISNKLLQQFVTCLQDKVGQGDEPEADAASEAASDSSTPAGSTSEPAADSQDGAVGRPAPPPSSTPSPSSAPGPSAGSRASTGSSGSSRSTSGSESSGSSSESDALDLGATVLPILARTYGPQAAIALVALVVGYLLGRRRG